MAEYIERSAAIEAAKHAWAKGLEPSQYIEALPAADVAPVVHGRWISWEKAGNFVPSPDRHECSVCHDAAQVLVNGAGIVVGLLPQLRGDDGRGDCEW